QAVDGIRARNVTGVQTCALPIYTEFSATYPIAGDTTFRVEFTPDPDYKISAFEVLNSYDTAVVEKTVTVRTIGDGSTIYVTPAEIGRASCRKRESVTGRASA